MNRKDNNIRHWAKFNAIANLRVVDFRLRSRRLNARKRKNLLHDKKTLEALIINLSQR